MNKKLLALATKNVSDIINIAIEHKPIGNALVVYDTRYGLTDILTEAYRAVLPNARFIDFDTVEKEKVIAAFDEMRAGDLVVLIQSSNFLLDAFRIRLHLFNKKLKVIEHLHLYRNTEDVWDVYINAIAYDPTWYRVIGPKLKAKLENIKELRIESGDQVLTVTGGVESPKLNIGDYAGMENVGGTFPIGEVFTEARDFAQMNGSFMLYGYADTEAFTIGMHKPFRVDVKEGLITSWQDNAPESFGKIIQNIKEFERPIIREIGFGLNRAITRERYMQDITAFERLVGLHFSLGEKHSVYKKEGITAHKSKFHVDVFPVADRILADGEVIFENGKYVV
ncbi:MAG: hypothetical protein HZB11_01140 [Candidatus Yonathbacteria bacterium]|nr:hypothetical protein [Candidatus Yonathbacteria bacterium]